MKVTKDLAILFFIRSYKAGQDGKAPIYCRLTMCNQRIHLSTGQKCLSVHWQSDIGFVNAKAPQAQIVNKELLKMKSELIRCYDRVDALGEMPSPESVKQMYLQQYVAAPAPKRHTIAEAFDRHILRFSQLVAKQRRAPGTLKRRKITKEKVLAFVKAEYGKQDFYLDQIKHAFASNFEHFLETVQGLGQNISMKYTAILKLVLKEAMIAEWIDKNPLAAFQRAYEDPNRQPITMDDLNSIMDKKFTTPRLSEVRDVYVFCCYTGFAYQEVYDLTRENLVLGINSKLWLTIDRKKTGEPEPVPLLPVAKEIITRYEEHPQCRISGKLLPVNSNQKYNSYLKEIADICGINKHLTTHTARHTFATTVALENGVPIETVSKMLGHSSIKTTQIYARITKRKISQDMDKLEETLASLPKKEQKQATA